MFTFSFANDSKFANSHLKCMYVVKVVTAVDFVWQSLRICMVSSVMCVLKSVLGFCFGRLEAVV